MTTAAILGTILAFGPQTSKAQSVDLLKEEFNAHKDEVRAIFIWAPS